MRAFLSAVTAAVIVSGGAACSLTVDLDPLRGTTDAAVPMDAAPDAPADADASVPPTDAGTDAPPDAPKLTYPQEVLADKPLAYYRLGEKTMSTAVDATGQGRDGTYSGPCGPGLGASGAITGDSNTALHTPAAAYCNVKIGGADTAFDFPNTTAFSIEAWLSAGTACNLSPEKPIVARTTTMGRGWGLFCRSADRVVFVRAGTSRTVSPEATISTNQFVHLVGTYDGQTIRLYLNGVAVGTGTADAVSVPTATTSTYVASGTDTVTLAIRYLQDAFVDEVAIYPAALSPARVKAHWDASR